MKRTSRKLSLHRETLLGLDAEAEARLDPGGRRRLGAGVVPVSLQQHVPRLELLPDPGLRLGDPHAKARSQAGPQP